MQSNRKKIPVSLYHTRATKTYSAYQNSQPTLDAPTEQLASEEKTLLLQHQLIHCADLKQLMFYQHRANQNKRRVPIVFLRHQKAGKTKVYVQKSHHLLFDVLKTATQKHRIQVVLEVFEVVCSLTKDHGFFYVDKLMMGVDKNGQPLVWINRSFSANHRQFPIKHSDAAETIFIRKLKNTFQSLIVFPFQQEIQSILQMRNYLQKVNNCQQKQNSKPSSHTFLCHKKTPYFALFSSKLQALKNKTTNQFVQIKKIYSQSFEANKQKTPCKSTKNLNFIPKFHPPNKDLFRYKSPSLNCDGLMNNKSELIQPSFVPGNKRVKKKLSLKLKISHQRENKNENTFCHSTFQSNSKFCCEEKNDKKQDTLSRKSWWFTQKQRQKVKSLVESRVLYEEQTVKINQAELEQEVENLFDSTVSEKCTSIKQSQLCTQLDELFAQSSLQKVGQNCLEDLEEILNN